ncbi:MAG: glycoside hydrolase family 3 N-terminal domain-containing protein, partial [Pseudohongiellaceae bacterium]
MMKQITTVLTVSALALMVGCGPSGNKDNDNGNGGGNGGGGSEPISYRTDHNDWPDITSKVALDPAIEAKVDVLLAGMTLEEKVGQMVQPEIKSASPQDVIDYHLGSVLNGGGSWPNNDKTASLADWVDLADQYWTASMDTTDGKAPIPLIWGTDAVHGHSNVYDTTLFPHNIGLGAAND